MKLAVIKHFREDLFGQNVLDQHFPHISHPEGGINRFFSVLEELYFGVLIGRVFDVSFLNFFTESFENGGKVSFKLIYRFPELCDLFALVSEKKR